MKKTCQIMKYFSNIMEVDCKEHSRNILVIFNLYSTLYRIDIDCVPVPCTRMQVAYRMLRIMNQEIKPPENKPISFLG